MRWETKKLCDLCYFDIHFNDLELSLNVFKISPYPRVMNIYGHTEMSTCAQESIIHRKGVVYDLHIYFNKILKNF